MKVPGKNQSIQPNDIFTKLIDDTLRSRLLIMSASILLGIISAFGCVVQIVQGDKYIALATLIFSLVSFINVAVLSFDPKKLTVSFCIFSANLIMLANYIMIYDETGLGFIWLLLLPACGCMFLGIKWGMALSLLLELEITAILWMPKLFSFVEAEYDVSFRVRYPIVFLCFFLAGCFLEYVRMKTYKELEALQVQFKEMSIRDALTGVYNRHWINNELPAKMKECSGREYLGVMILDLDFFKSVNDTYGHLFGDTVLKALSDMLKVSLEEYGSVCRWGGEEFAVLTKGTDKEATLKLAEQIRQNVEDMEFEFEGKSIHITISVGAVSMIPTADMRASFLIDCADKALYEAKNKGRNNVQYHEETWRYRDI